nr:uncharacterized protein LOC117693138 [Crassostrea gigas]
MSISITRVSARITRVCVPIIWVCIQKAWVSVRIIRGQCTYHQGLCADHQVIRTHHQGLNAYHQDPVDTFTDSGSTYSDPCNMYADPGDGYTDPGDGHRDLGSDRRIPTIFIYFQYYHQQNKQIVQNRHLRVSGNSTDSGRSETSNRTIKSGSSYSSVRCVQNRDDQNVHGTEDFRISNHSRSSNSTQQSGSSYGDVQVVQNRDGHARLQHREEFNELPIDYDNTEENEATGMQQSSYCRRGTRLNPGTFRGQPVSIIIITFKPVNPKSI